MSKAEERALEAYPVIMETLIPANEEDPEVKQDCNMFTRKAFQQGYELALEESKMAPFPSPFTGGNVFIEEKKETLKYRGEDITINRKYYRCEDTGNEFSDSEVDNDMMWAVFRAYWEKKGFEHFYDIDGYKE